MPDAQLLSDGTIYRWLIWLDTGRTVAFYCHRSRSLLIATVHLWWWQRKLSRRPATAGELIEHATDVRTGADQ